MSRTRACDMITRGLACPAPARYDRAMVVTRLPMNATYDDLLAAPEDVTTELIDGELFMSPQPKVRHSIAASAIGRDVGHRFGRRGAPDEGWPGGWWILDEPEIHLALDRRVVVPDVAGWRRERMPNPTRDTHKMTVVPDWVCEVLSPGSRRFDYLKKMPAYARAGVGWLWMVEPADRQLVVYEREGEEWVERMAFEGSVAARLRPFEAVELDLGEWWEEPEGAVERG